MNNDTDIEQVKPSVPTTFTIKLPEDNSTCFQKTISYLKSIPLFVGFMTTTIFIFYIFTLILPNFTLFFSNRPSYTLEKFNLWTLITSVFINTKIIVLIFTLLTWLSDAIRLENCNGTIRYMLNFFVNSIIIQVIYTIISYLLSFLFFKHFFGELLEQPSHGLLPVVMAEITILSLANKDTIVKMFFTPFSFKAKYYPWTYFGFFLLVGGFVVLIDILSGIVYGYLFFHILKKYIQFKDKCILRLEKLCCNTCIAKVNGILIFVLKSKIRICFNTKDFRR